MNVDSLREEYVVLKKLESIYVERLKHIVLRLEEIKELEKKVKS